MGLLAPLQLDYQQNSAVTEMDRRVLNVETKRGLSNFQYVGDLLCVLARMRDALDSLKSVPRLGHPEDEESPSSVSQRTRSFDDLLTVFRVLTCEHLLPIEEVIFVVLILDEFLNDF